MGEEKNIREFDKLVYNVIRGVHMAEIPEKVERIVKEYLSDLNRDIPVSKAILFGSYAKGTYRKDSDIDLAVFSDFFTNMRRVDGISFLLQRVKNFEYDLEPLAFASEDYLAKDGFVAEILKEGIEIPIMIRRE